MKNANGILVNQVGDESVLQYTELTLPELSSNDVLIKVKAIGINYIDIYFRSGVYPIDLPFTPGKEASGEVVEIGKDVQDFKVGDRVATCNGGSGTYAEYLVINAGQVVELPSDVSYELGAACLLQGLTAYYLTQLTFPLEQDDVALIHAAAGGVGLLTVQMAKIAGATVIGTVSTEEKKREAMSAGADHVILYNDEDVLARVKEITGGEGVDVVYDSVGQSTFDASLESLRPLGMMVSFGQSSGMVSPLQINRLSSLGSLFLTRPVLFDYIPDKETLSDCANELFDMIEEGLQFKIGGTYALKDVQQAHKDLAGRKTMGKLILTV
jgi:NADPH:quinone reductase